MFFQNSVKRPRNVSDIRVKLSVAVFSWCHKLSTCVNKQLKSFVDDLRSI